MVIRPTIQTAELDIDNRECKYVVLFNLYFHLLMLYIRTAQLSLLW
jgi:hypothetical protein